MHSGVPLKKQYQARKAALWQERQSWINRYSDVTKFLLPYAGRYFMQDRNKGDRTFNDIYDETATYALDTLAAGLMAGMTSPARPWFRLATSDHDLMESEPVKMWLFRVTELMRRIFAKSNTYNALHSLYEELGAFATGATIIEADFDNVIHHTVLTAGQYAIAADDRGYVDTVCREFEMTLLNVVSKFVRRADGSMDWSVVSPTIKNMWDTHKNLDSWVPVVHLIQPRENRDTRKYDAKNMKFASCYFEPSSGEGDDRFLRESGYKRFPALCPRWHTRGGDIYGNGPSFRALGSIKQLQHEQLRKGQALDYMAKPPIAVPAGLINTELNLLPGGVTYIPMGAQAQDIRPTMQTNMNIQHTLLDIQDVRHRIDRAFYADLFLMISGDNRRTPATATEIAERQDEKLLMLGPVLERLHNELLSPKIDLTFAFMIESGILPPPPPELQGQDIQVEFVSTLAQAQKLVGLGAHDRFLGTVAQLAAGSGDVSVWDKVNKDEAIDRYADMLGVDPSLIVADDKVAIVREDRAKAMASQQQAAMIPAGAAAARDLAAADTSGQNALTDVLKQVQGYSASV